jgi:hypothetical protein
VYYGDLVTVVPDKIRISEKELAPIGILDQSVCWSRWVPDRWVAFDAVQPPPHLVISPFEIASWPVLFRLSIFLEDGQGGALAKALHVLAANAFNILAIEGTPAGHHHAVVNVIGEAVEIKFDANTLDAISSFDDRERNFKNGALAANIHQIYAPRLLSYSRRLVEALQDADAGADGRFLRHSFALHRKTDRPRGILYNAEDLPPEVADIGHEQSTRAVTCKWLQNHAFFWIYGEGDVSEKKLIYNARTWALRPEAVWKHQFGETIARLKPPFKAISSINFEEQYLRLTFSPYDRRGNTFRLKLPYAARFSAPGITTQGALAAALTRLRRLDLGPGRGAWLAQGGPTWCAPRDAPARGSTDRQGRAECRQSAAARHQVDVQPRRLRRGGPAQADTAAVARAQPRARRRGAKQLASASPAPSSARLPGSGIAETASPDSMPSNLPINAAAPLWRLMRYSPLICDEPASTLSAANAVPSGSTSKPLASSTSRPRLPIRLIVGVLNAPLATCSVSVLLLM